MAFWQHANEEERVEPLVLNFPCPARPRQEHVGIHAHAVVGQELCERDGVSFQQFALAVITGGVGDDAVVPDGQQRAGFFEELARGGEDEGMGFVLRHAHAPRHGDYGAPSP